jgi:hypothetical protein
VLQRWWHFSIAICACLSASHAVAQDEVVIDLHAPLSAIDWLSESIRTPQIDGSPFGLSVTDGITQDSISVIALDAPSPEATGLFPAERARLPRDFWGTTQVSELVGRIAEINTDTVPIGKDLIYRILLAEFDPPPQTAQDQGAPAALLLARIDKLLDFGALDQALSLIEAIGANDPDIFRRWFDVALLIGQEDRACTTMRARPNLSPTYVARVYCLARGGDWSTAALTLRSAAILGYISAAEEELLDRFLDPEAAEMLLAPPPISPLIWRILEAIGEPIGTQTLPVAFAHADLRGTSGWRSQLEAAERLTRSGALAPNRLLGLYSENRPAASGGIWDRVNAVQRFETALTSGDPFAVSTALTRLWPLVQAAELEVCFASLFADGLARLPLTGEAGDLAFEISLLTESYEQAATNARPQSDRAKFLVAVARGLLIDAPQYGGALGAAVADAFVDPPPVSDDSIRRVSEGHLGDEVLRAVEFLAQGALGDTNAATQALSLLRYVRLEDEARRAALQLMILQRNG